MAILKNEWREFLTELRAANGFEVRELLFRGPRFGPAHKTNFGEYLEGDWPMFLPGCGAEREFVVAERKNG